MGIGGIKKLCKFDDIIYERPQNSRAAPQCGSLKWFLTMSA